MAQFDTTAFPRNIQQTPLLPPNRAFPSQPLADSIPANAMSRRAASRSDRRQHPPTAGPSRLRSDDLPHSPVITLADYENYDEEDFFASLDGEDGSAARTRNTKKGKSKNKRRARGRSARKSKDKGKGKMPQRNQDSPPSHSHTTTPTNSSQSSLALSSISQSARPPSFASSSASLSQASLPLLPNHNPSSPSDSDHTSESDTSTTSTSSTPPDTSRRRHPPAGLHHQRGRHPFQNLRQVLGHALTFIPRTMETL